MADVRIPMLYLGLLVVGQSRIADDRTFEGCPGELGLVQFHANEGCALKVSVTQVTGLKIDILEFCSFKRGLPQISILKRTVSRA